MYKYCFTRKNRLSGSQSSFQNHSLQKKEEHMLKLVYLNPNPIPEHQSISLDTPNSNNPEMSKNPSFRETILASILPLFSTEVCFTAPSSYTMAAHDFSHYLSCELPLEIRTSFDESDFGDVVCHFPIIEEKYLEALVWEDKSLLDMIMVQFYLKILEQLFVFCLNHNALKLVIHIDPNGATNLNIYNKFVVDIDQILTHKGRKEAFVIPTDLATYGKLIDYIEQVGTDFRHSMLQDNNPIVQQYLKFASFAFKDRGKIANPIIKQ
jgi:hypothetical protein